MQDRPDRTDNDTAREGGPYADFIRDLVESGRYGSAAEVVLDALALLQKRELARSSYDDHMRKLVQVGIDQADRGETIPAEEVFAEMRARIEAKVLENRG
jgi:antitoxin ParD1/3/4